MTLVTYQNSKRSMVLHNVKKLTTYFKRGLVITTTNDNVMEIPNSEYDWFYTTEQEVIE